MAKLLIAGYGFLGVAIREEFRSTGWEVKTLGRSDGVDRRCDLTEPDQVSAISEDYDLVIQCAASNGGGEEAYRAIYLEAASNLLRRFDARKFIFVSSTSVYAQQSHEEVTESSPAEPTTATGKILKQTEDEVLGQGGRVARLSGLYGPGRCHVLKALRNGTARLDLDGRRMMNFVHRADAASALRMMAEQSQPSTIVNISAGSVSQKECYQSLTDYFSLPLPPLAEENTLRKRGNGSKTVSSQRMKSMGWEPQYPDFLSMSLACSVE